MTEAITVPFWEELPRKEEAERECDGQGSSNRTQQLAKVQKQELESVMDQRRGVNNSVR
jgi:hypothetical protein